MCCWRQGSLWHWITLISLPRVVHAGVVRCSTWYMPEVFLTVRGSTDFRQLGACVSDNNRRHPKFTDGSARAMHYKHDMQFAKPDYTSQNLGKVSAKEGWIWVVRIFFSKNTWPSFYKSLHAMAAREGGAGTSPLAQPFRLRTISGSKPSLFFRETLAVPNIPPPPRPKLARGKWRLWTAILDFQHFLFISSEQERKEGNFQTAA